MDHDGSIELAPLHEPTPPVLPGAVVVRSDADTLIDALLADIAIHAGNCVRAFGDFFFAVGVCPAIEPVLRRLLFDLNYREFPWQRTRVWLTEEVAPRGGEESPNWSNILGHVVEPSGMPLEQAHRIAPCSQEGANAYAAALREHLGWREKGHDRLDLVLVALEPGGRVGGVGSQDERSTPRELVQFQVCEGNARVALTSRCVNAARMVAVFAPGAAQRAEVARASELFRGKHTDPAFPASLLSPRHAELRWYLDADACVRQA